MSWCDKVNEMALHYEETITRARTGPVEGRKHWYTIAANIADRIAKLSDPHSAEVATCWEASAEMARYDRDALS